MWQKLQSRAVTPEQGEAVSTQQNEQKESISTSTNKAHSILVLGTKDYLFDVMQMQSLNNKMDEFIEVVTVLKPKVTGITESCTEGKSECDISLEGFTPYRDDRGTGVILCILRTVYSQHHVQKLTQQILGNLYGVLSL